MSNKNGLFTDGSDSYAPRANSIPLTDADVVNNDSIGDLVSNATAQMSSLFRSEVELAKAEIKDEAKKATIGGGLFVVAATIVLYSTFFFFFAIAELINLWLPRWSSMLIIFVLMLLVAAAVAFFGYRKLKKLQVPQETISSVGELKKLRPGQAEKTLSAPERGMYS